MFLCFHQSLRQPKGKNSTLPIEIYVNTLVTWSKQLLQYVCLGVYSCLYLGLSRILLFSSCLAAGPWPSSSFFFLRKRKKKEFFSDSKFPPSYPPTDTILFSSGDNFIHLHIIVSNSIGKLLPHASELGRTVMSSFWPPPPPPNQPPLQWDFYCHLFRHEMSTVTKK